MLAKLRSIFFAKHKQTFLPNESKETVDWIPHLTLYKTRFDRQKRSKGKNRNFTATKEEGEVEGDGDDGDDDEDKMDVDHEKAGGGKVDVEVKEEVKLDISAHETNIQGKESISVSTSAPLRGRGGGRGGPRGGRGSQARGGGRGNQRDNKQSQYHPTARSEGQGNEGSIHENGQRAAPMGTVIQELFKGMSFSLIVFLLLNDFG